MYGRRCDGRGGGCGSLLLAKRAHGFTGREQHQEAEMVSYLVVCDMSKTVCAFGEEGGERTTN